MSDGGPQGSGFIYDDSKQDGPTLSETIPEGFLEVALTQGKRLKFPGQDSFDVQDSTLLLTVPRMNL